jgi:hypothetical protein
MNRRRALPTRRSTLPSLWALLFLAACIAAAGFVTFRADAQNTPAQTSGQRPPPSKAEESATIEDDPTVAPDEGESADNNVSFPVDI